MSFKRNVITVVAKAIADGTLQIEVPPAIRAFYSINSAEEWNMDCDVNSTWLDLKNNGIFNGGFFVHDFDEMGFTIHQKLRHLRHALFHRHLGLQKVEEYIPWIDAQHEVDAWKQRFIDLKAEKYDDADWNIELADSGVSDMLRFVVHEAVRILFERQWIDEIQWTALTLQFELRSSVKSSGRFAAEHRRFLQNGIPMVSDLTAQSLFWECIWLLCLNETNILPPIHRFFDGPMFHFMCHLQRDETSKYKGWDWMREILKPYYLEDKHQEMKVEEGGASKTFDSSLQRKREDSGVIGELPAKRRKLN